MRVVDRKTFLTLLPGTVYCKGVQWAFDSISVKGDSLSNDWFYLNPAWPDALDSGEAVLLLEQSLREGISFQCETAEGRDGCFDNDAVFLIFECEDLLVLRALIDTALTIRKGD